MAVYRLGALLDIRERAEQNAKEAFAAAQHELKRQQDLQAAEERRLVEMQEERLRRREEYSQKLAAGEMKVTDQSSVTRFIERMKEKEAEQIDRIEAQQEQVRIAEKSLKRAQDDLIEATQQLKALQKHKEKWAEEIRRDRMAKEEDAMDEIGQAIFNMRRR